MCYGKYKMMNSMPLLVLTLATALAAPSGVYDDYVERVPQKRAALVLDRLLIALRKALSEDRTGNQREDRDGPRTAPLRITEDDLTDMVLREPVAESERSVYQRLDSDDETRQAQLQIAGDELSDMSSLERRGQNNPSKGRVIRCYFNAVTCF